MPTLGIVLPGAGAFAALVAAADAQFGSGSVNWLIELCLSDADEMVTAPGLPMKTGNGALLLSLAACALASVSCLLAWQRGEGDPEPDSSADAELRLLAALAMLANASGRLGAHEIDFAFAHVTGFTLPQGEADAAMSVYGTESFEEDLELFAEVERPAERGMIICGAIELAREDAGEERLVRLIGAIAATMGMKSEEIIRHWQVYRGEAPSEMPALNVQRARSGRLQSMYSMTHEFLRHFVRPRSSELIGGQK